MPEERRGGNRRGLLVACERLGRGRTVSEHLRCPYCYGDPADVERGDRACFCDYEPDRDATVFGFPETFGHFARG